MKVRVEVTQDDIDKGKPGNPCKCMLALAISRAMGEPWEVGFSFADNEIEVDGEWVRTRRADLPGDALQAILSFDRHETVMPFDFEMEVEEVQP